MGDVNTSGEFDRETIDGILDILNKPPILSEDEKRLSTQKHAQPIPKNLIISLENVQIDNHELIAQSIYGEYRKENFIQRFAFNIVKQKIENLEKTGMINITYDDGLSIFPFSIVFDGNLYLAQISPGRIVEDARKDGIHKYAGHIKKQLEMESINPSGILHFAPFTMNGQTLRNLTVDEFLRRNINMRFVNLGYNSDSLERRAKLYAAW